MEGLKKKRNEERVSKEEKRKNIEVEVRSAFWLVSTSSSVEFEKTKYLNIKYVELRVSYWKFASKIWFQYKTVWTFLIRMISYGFIRIPNQEIFI